MVQHHIQVRYLVVCHFAHFNFVRACTYTADEGHYHDPARSVFAEEQNVVAVAAVENYNTFCLSLQQIHFYELCKAYVGNAARTREAHASARTYAPVSIMP
eukprot:1476651-Pyramimonas_sp.AAC.1